MALTMDRELETVTITDPDLGDVQITGWRIGEVSSRYGPPEDPRPPRARWGVNTVWKIPSGGYVAVQIARSVIFHTDPTYCRTPGGNPPGEFCWPADLPEDALACADCRPPDPEDLAKDEPLRFEFDRVQVVQCETKAQVVSELTSRRKEGRTVTVISAPVRALLEQCGENDPAWDDAPARTVRIH